MANQPQFGAVPVVGFVNETTANTSRAGSGTLGTVVTGAVNGTRIDTVVFQSTETNAAGTLRLFINNGSSTFLYKEIATSAVTPSGTVAAAAYTLSGLGLVLPSGYELLIGVNNASESWNVIALGENF